MKPEDSEMAKSTTMTVRITPDVSEKLDMLARDMKRSGSYLAADAIAAYIERHAWQMARIREALEEARSGAPGVPHDEVVRWLKSWGTAHELPRPEAKS